MPPFRKLVYKLVVLQMNHLNIGVFYSISILSINKCINLQVITSILINQLIIFNFPNISGTN